MAQTLAQKLKIKEDHVLRTLNAPAGFAQALGPLPEGVHLSTGANRFDQLHWFVGSRAQLEAELGQVLDLVTGNVVCWIYYPKGSSKVQTDLTRDKGWDALLAHDELQWLSLISFDATWSAFAFRKKGAAAEKRAAQPTERPILAYIDPVKRQILLPDDLAAAFRNEKEAAAFFNELSFTNQKEYVEWIVNARRAETRQQRVEGTIERLGRGWKNPRNM